MIRTEGLLKVLFEDSRNVVFIIDEDYTIRYASATVETIFGVSPISILGKNGFDFIPQNKREQWLVCLTSNGNKSCEITLPTNNGDERHFDVTVADHEGQDEIRGHVVFMHDITEHQQIQQKLETENNQLDHFIYKTTHDLRAPLRSALGLVALAEHDPQEYRRYLEMIKSSLLQLDSLIEEVNSFYKNDKLAIQNERIDIRAVVQKEIDNLRNMQEAADICFDIFVDGDVPFYSDSLRVRTILANLLSNAIKYHDPSKLRKYIQISAHVFIDKLFLTVEDNGIGIAPEHTNQIFDLFFRATSDKKGSGLGLYIVKDTVERLSGKIYVKSHIEEGTAFTVMLPNFITEGLN